MTDTDMNNLSLYLEKNYGLTSDRVIAKAVDIVANDNSFHPIIDLLESLTWDGTPRIHNMLNHFFGASDPEYSGEIMKMHNAGGHQRLYDRGRNMISCSVWWADRNREIYIFQISGDPG